MGMTQQYAATEPAREEVDALEGPVIVEFGAPWCGHCMAAQPLLAAAFSDHPQVRHLKIEDGRGRRLGRSFGIKLWPTLVFLDNGREVERVTRPLDVQELLAGFALIDGKQAGNT